MWFWAGGRLPSPLVPDMKEGHVGGAYQPGAPAGHSTKEPQLFPLPRFACPPRLQGLSRTVQQRRSRIRKVVSNCNEVVDALNWMAGTCQADLHVPPSPMQVQALARVEGLVHDQKPSGAVATPEEALRSLLRGGAPYDWKPSAETLASYRSDLVSVPDDVSGCPQLRDVLPPDDCRYLEEQSELMLSEIACVEEGFEPYWDPALRFNKKSYNDLVLRLHKIGYFQYTTQPRCRVGIFFVWKSSRTRLRMITDARLSNLRFKAAPGVSLMTAESFGRFEVEFDGEIFADPELVSKLTAFIGLNDVKDCFHRLRVPLWMARYFAWEAVPAKTVGLENTYVDGKFVGPLDAVFPCAGSLCQGFSWSLYFAQKANEYLAKSTPLLAQARLLHDRGDPLVLRVGHDAQEADHFYVYVDNLGVIGTDHERIVEAMEDLRVKFDGLGLELHGSEVSNGSVEALGCIIEGNRLRSRITLARLWKVHQGIEGLLRRRRCSGRALEVVLGHLTFCGLMSRPSLSILHGVYPFILKRRESVGLLWPSIIHELRAFKGILFMLVQDWWRKWNRMVLSSDASLHGYGVCQAWWPKAKVAECGRQTERSRFRRVSAHSARESALQAAGLSVDERGRCTDPHGDACRASLAQAGWDTDDGFKEVPHAGLVRRLWHATIHGKWQFKEDILVLEARAVMKGIRRALLTRYGHDVRQLALCDNLAVVLTFERCRSRNYQVLKVLRQFAAFCFARNVRVAIRWIPSELNISDEGSRLAEGAKDSKLLIDLLGDSWAEDFVADGCGPLLPHGSGKPGLKDGAQADADSEPAWCDTQPSCNAARGKQEENARGVQGRGPKCAEEEGWPKETSTPRGWAHIPNDRKLPGADEASGDGCPASEDANNSADETRQLRRKREHFVRVQGRQRRRESSFFEKQAKKRASALCQLPLGPRVEQPQFAGAGGSLNESETDLHQATARPAFPCEGGRVGLRIGRSHRSRACGVCQHEVQHDGGFDGQASTVWTPGEPQSPSGLEMSPRMEKAVPLSLEACLPSSGMVWHQLAHGGTRTRGQGLIQPPPGLNLPPTWNTAEASEDGASEAHSWSDKPLVGRYQSGGNHRRVQNRDQGRLSPDRQSVAGLCWTPLRSAGKGGQDGPRVQVRLLELLENLPRSLSRPQAPAGSLPSTPLRALDRQGEERQDSRRSSKAGRLAEPAERGQVRESGQAGCDVAEAGRGCSDVLSSGRAIHRGDYARPSLSGDPSPWPVKKGSYFGDFFAGSGRISRAANALGFQTRSWELEWGCNHDLTSPHVLSKIKFDIRKRLVLGGMIAPPCLSFSVARDRTGVIRTKDFPWGLPGLSDKDKEKVDVGNKCMCSAFILIRELDSQKLPWLFEHPHSSKAWYLPELQRLQGSSHVQTVVTDFCQWGAKWRKRTRFLSGNIGEDDAEGCSRICQGHRGFCSRTYVKHVQLTGKHVSGANYTQLAQAYPHHLCHRLVRAALSRYMIVPFNS